MPWRLAIVLRSSLSEYFLGLGRGEAGALPLILKAATVKSGCLSLSFVVNKTWVPFAVLLALVAVAIGVVAFYVHGVRGAAFFDEAVTARAFVIIELLLFLLLAILLGMALGWWLQEPRYQNRQNVINDLAREHTHLHEERVQLLHTNSQLRTQLVHVHDAYRAEKTRLQNSLEELQRQHAAEVAELEKLRLSRVSADTNELDLLRFKNRQLTQQLGETEEQIRQQKLRLEELANKQPDFEPGDQVQNLHHQLKHLKDDLSRIRGIGPVLEKQLNDLGIYTFQQIAEFNAQQIDRIDAHIRFPGRVLRERWIEQARQFIGR
jgi:predicted flap endonuclease-1-like 5' DNA nuclease/membrane protein implicated in regulation of membrane protease activity